MSEQKQKRGRGKVQVQRLPWEGGVQERSGKFRHNSQRTADERKPRRFIIWRW